jgi:hypothetical protein
MTIVSTILKALQKAPKKAKKALKGLLMTPKIIYSGLQRIWEILASVGSKLLILPLDKLSGKLLAASEILFVTTLLLGAGYGFGLWRGRESLVALTGSLLVFSLIAFVLLGVGFLITYPLDRAGLIREVIVRSGLRQRNRISTGRVSVLLGSATAVLVTVLVGNQLILPAAGLSSLFISTAGLRTPFVFELGFWPVVATFLLSFVLATALVHQSLHKKGEIDTRTDLSIVEVTDRDGTQILRIRNDSDTLVDLTASKIQDSRGSYYSLEHALTFRPGETLTLTLPEGFKLAATELQVPTGLSAIYDDKRVTTIYALSGETFLLEWGSDVEIE